MAADSVQAAQHVRDIGAEDAPIRVNLIHNHEPEIREEAGPTAVIGQDSLVQHVGVCHDHVGFAAQPAPGRHGRVAVIGAAPDQLRELWLRLRQSAQPSHLILRQRLCGKEVERLRVRLAQQRFEDREVVAQRLAAGRAGDDRGVLALSQPPDRRRLVRVEATYPEFLQRLPDRLRKPRRQPPIRRLPRRYLLDMHDLPGIAGSGYDLFEELCEVCAHSLLPLTDVQGV